MFQLRAIAITILVIVAFGVAGTSRAEVAACVRQANGELYNNAITDVARCTIQIAGKTHVNNACKIRRMSKSMLALGEGPSDQFSVHVAIDGLSAWSGIGGTRVNTPLGVLRSNGSCWENEKVKVCVSGDAHYLIWKNVEARCRSILKEADNIDSKASAAGSGIEPLQKNPAASRPGGGAAGRIATNGSKSKVETYPVAGGWSLYNANDKEDWKEGCDWYRENKNLKNKDGDTIASIIIVFEQRRQIQYGGHHGSDGWERTLLSIKLIGPNTYELFERFYLDGEGGTKPGWVRSRSRLQVLNTDTIKFGTSKDAATYRRCRD